MRVTIVMWNQELYLIWNSLKILKIWTRTRYVILSSLMLVKILLMMNVMTMLHK